ncbi:aminoacyl-tRNA deacylase [Xenophilus sp.]|uniref:aminoacyl-tRNA deacylase n=1 Tax=Xenophilus sp. TaxID=1873499 RepID=UPI0037DCD5FF
MNAPTLQPPPAPAAIEDVLRRHRIEARIEQLQAPAPTAEAAARLLGCPVSRIAKTMVLTDDDAYAVVVMPGDRRLVRRLVSAALGMGPLRFATADEVRAQTGHPPGGVAPIAFPGSPRVVVDEALMRRPQETVAAGGGREDLLLHIRPGDIVRFHGARVAAISHGVPQ